MIWKMMTRLDRTCALRAAALALCTAAMCGCDIDDAEHQSADELGSVQRTYTVTADRGAVQLPIYSNKAGTAVVSGDASSWLAIADNGFDGDKTLLAEYLSNDGFPRQGDILLVTDTRVDTVSIRQEGTEELFSFPEQSVIVLNGTGKTYIQSEVNVPLRKVDIEVRYISGDGWILQYGIGENGLWIETQDNEDAANVRSAQMVLSYTDGWGELRRSVILVTQARSDNNVGIPYTFQELRSLASTASVDLPDDVYIEGYVVSTTEYGQAGEVAVEEVSPGVVDYESNEVTVYLESLDGKYGFRLLTVDAEENTFVRNTRVGLLLGGAIITRTADVPVRYTISEVTSSMIVSSRDATGEVPVKRMSIKDITDNDVYTYVTLEDCEIPMRKGPLTPVNEGYGALFSNNRSSKYPMLIRDKEGGSMYMYTNYACPYRRDGSKLPYGSGTISGVIVHEYFRPFVDADNSNELYCGNIGRYQIRHMSRDDIQLSDSFEDSFSGLITEFRYLRQPAAGQTTELPGAILATYGNGEATHTYTGYRSILNLRTTNFYSSYFYLGPCGNSYKKQYGSGAGIILEDGTDYLPVPEGREGAQNTDGKGWFTNDLYLSWGNKYWWDNANGRGYCWLFAFSTQGITSDRVSMQFAMYNNSQSLRSPRYWKAQYSLTTSDTSAASDSQWTDIGEFTVPDVVIWNSTVFGQSVGTKVFDFELPVEILGRDKVYIRLMPRSSAAAITTTDTYDGSTISNNVGCNTMDYFAVRYNK